MSDGLHTMALARGHIVEEFLVTATPQLSRLRPLDLYLRPAPLQLGKQSPCHRSPIYHGRYSMMACEEQPEPCTELAGVHLQALGHGAGDACHACGFVRVCCASSGRVRACGLEC